MHKDITAYITQFPANIQNKLEEMYGIIKEVVPEETTEKISWQMPTFYLNGNVVHFAGHKNHIGFYPGASGIAQFKDHFEGLTYAKGSVQFPYTTPLPKALIQKIVTFRIEENKR